MMNYSTTSLFHMGMLFLLGACSPENEGESDGSGNGMLGRVEQIVGGEEIQSEAYIVLKSDEVRYMADMEVMFFEHNIKQAFNALIEEREEARQDMSAQALSNNPRLSSFMNELIKRRKALAEREKSIDGKVEEVRRKMVAELIASIKNLSEQIQDLDLQAQSERKERFNNLNRAIASMDKRLTEGGKVLEEFRQITTPYDDAIKAAKEALEGLKEKETVEELEQKAFEGINRFIVTSRLKIPKLSSSSRILESAERRVYGDRKWDEELFIIKTRMERPQYEFGSIINYLTYMTRVPHQCANPTLASFIEKLHDLKVSVEERASSYRSKISSLQSQRKNDLIPWENRHNVSQKDFGAKQRSLSEWREAFYQRINVLRSQTAIDGLWESLLQSKCYELHSDYLNSFANRNRYRSSIFSDDRDELVEGKSWELFMQLNEDTSLAAILKGKDDVEELFERRTHLQSEVSEKQLQLKALQGTDPERDELLRQQVFELKSQIEREREEIDDAEAEVHQEAIRSMSEQFLEVHYRKFINMLGAKSKLSIRTGSKGNFIVPAGMDYLFASRERENGEYIYWFLPIETKFGNFRLSNSNAFMGSRRNKKSWMFEEFILN